MIRMAFLCFPALNSCFFFYNNVPGYIEIGRPVATYEFPSVTNMQLPQRNSARKIWRGARNAVISVGPK